VLLPGEQLLQLAELQPERWVSLYENFPALTAKGLEFTRLDCISRCCCCQGSSCCSWQSCSQTGGLLPDARLFFSAYICFRARALDSGVDQSDWGKPERRLTMPVASQVS
jgi:hypothetical protein